MSQNSQHVINYKNRIKQALFLASGAKCAICGFNEQEPGLYDFHHLDPNEKEYALSAFCGSKEKAASEAKKCILVCPICHRKIHFNLLDNIPKNAFNEELFYESYEALCPTSKQQENNAKRDYPTRQQLKDDIRNLTLTAASEKYNISIAGLKKWCQKEQLPYQKKVIKSYSDEQWKTI